MVNRSLVNKSPVMDKSLVRDEVFGGEVFSDVVLYED